VVTEDLPNARVLCRQPMPPPLLPPLPPPGSVALATGVAPDSSCVVFGFPNSAKANCANGGCDPAYCARTPSFRCGTHTTILGPAILGGCCVFPPLKSHPLGAGGGSPTKGFFLCCSFFPICSLYTGKNQIFMWRGREEEAASVGDGHAAQRSPRFQNFKLEHQWAKPTVIWIGIPEIVLKLIWRRRNPEEGGKVSGRPVAD